jgi:hypothetical protein
MKKRTLTKTVGERKGWKKIEREAAKDTVAETVEMSGNQRIWNRCEPFGEIYQRVEISKSGDGSERADL